MRTIDAVIIGAGQAGLAMSHCLGQHGIEHVVLEKGRLAERWRSQRWDSLKLLSPNWQSRLPGWNYSGQSPNDFMGSSELVRFLEGYAASFEAPVRSESQVLSVSQSHGAYRVVTTRDCWRSRIVIIATGHANEAAVPRFAKDLSTRIPQFVTTGYRNPSDLPDGGVLIVGASASGVQLAEEIQASGRQVTLSVGAHTRLPRRYRGHDIMWWLDRMGILDQRIDDLPNLERSRRQPSLQLVGRSDQRNIDLETLQKQGVHIVGSCAAANGRRIRFNDDLGATTARADAKLMRILADIDGFADRNALTLTPANDELNQAVKIDNARTEIDVQREGIQSVLWCTGYKRSYPWLNIPVLNERGDIAQQGGITAIPGLYTLGHMLMRRRNSSFLDGVGRDAEFLGHHIRATLDQFSRRAA